MGATEPVTVEVPCLLPSEPVPRPAWRLFSEKHEDIDAKTAYFCVGTFLAHDPDFAAADPETRDQILADQYDGYARVFESIRSKAALLLDLRGNGGGTDLLGQALALHLMKPGFHYLRLGSKRRGRWHELGWQDPEVGRGTPRFEGRVVCLIDENCLSVTDNLAASLRDEHPNVLFVGQPTGGGSGLPRTFTLPSTNARVTFCTLRVYAPNGTYVEGNGVQPDVLVRSSREQMLAGEDAVLEAALATLRD
jgi:C-terminal processing protease CtpA/Prc